MYLVSKIVNHVTYLFVYRSGFIVMIRPLFCLWLYGKANIKKRNFTCEICNTKVDDFDIAFLEVHHIYGNKAYNREQNIKCLCIRCHSQIDQTHTAHYTSNGRRMLLQLFEEKYQKK